jgi:hypothetical protein
MAPLPADLQVDPFLIEPHVHLRRVIDQEITNGRPNTDEEQFLVRGIAKFFGRYMQPIDATMSHDLDGDAPINARGHFRTQREKFVRLVMRVAGVRAPSDQMLARWLARVDLPLPE